jgi:branched-chain amino acid transport system substrate-binding protein
MHPHARLRTLFAGAALALVAAGASSVTASAQTIKVGIINTYSGPEAQVGDELDKGLKLYVKEHEKDLPPGVKIELIVRDDTGPNPEVAKRLAQELITRERVQFLAGVVWSPNAAAIAPLTAEAKVPFVLMNAAGVAIPRLSPYITRTSFTLWQQALPLGKWVAGQGWKKGYTAVSDFIPGHDAEGGFQKGFTDAGGQMVGSVRIPLANPDFVPFLQRAMDAKPDVLFIFIPAGRQAGAIMKAATDLGVQKAGIRIVATQDLLPEEELPKMGDEPVGIISSGTWSMAADRPANKAFLAAWAKEYTDKAIPDFMSVGGYDGMAAIFEVIKKTNGKFTGDQAMQILKGWRHESPRGPIQIDADTRDIIQNVYMRKTEKVNGKLANVEFDTIPMVKDPWKELNPPK